QIAEQTNLGGKITIDRSGGDSGALADGGDRHRGETAFHGCRARCAEDCRTASSKPLGYSFGPAVDQLRFYPPACAFSRMALSDISRTSPSGRNFTCTIARCPA